MTALDDRPTLADTQRADQPPPTGRLVVLDLDHPTVRAVLARWDPTGAHHMADDLAHVAEPVTEGDPLTHGHHEDGAWVGHTWPTYTGPMSEA